MSCQRLFNCVFSIAFVNVIVIYFISLLFSIFIFVIVAPWQASGEGSFTAGGKKEKSLLEIQQEEERQLLAERKQKQEGPNSGRSGATGSVTSGGVWAASPQKLSWSQHTQVSILLLTCKSDLTSVPNYLRRQRFPVESPGFFANNKDCGLGGCWITPGDSSCKLNV